MKKYFFIPVYFFLLSVTMCDQNITGSGNNGRFAEIEPGIFIATMDVGSNYLVENSTLNSGGILVIEEKFQKVPFYGDLEGTGSLEGGFEGSINSELDSSTNRGDHEGTGVLKLSNGLVFEVVLNGTTIDGKDSGYLQGYDRGNGYEIQTHYTEKSSCRGNCNRPLMLEGTIGYLRYYPWN